METMESRSEVLGLIEEFREAVRERRFAQAEVLLDRMDDSGDAEAVRPVYRTMLELARGDAIGELRRLRSLDPPPEDLIAVCLRVAGDPTWEGLARALADDSPDPTVRRAMAAMLDR